MFSVIIPVYNHQRYLRQAVLSAVSNRLVNEVLLLDDGSSDSSYDIVRELSGGALRVVRDLTPSPRINRGAHVCLNELAEAASSEWIAILNSDDVFIGDRFEAIARTLRMEQADFIFGDLLVIDEKGRQLGIKNGPFHPQYPFPKTFPVSAMAAKGQWLALLANQNFIATTSNLVFHKGLISKVGGFRPLRYIHDWDFALRATLKGRAAYIPHPLTCYRIHSANTIKESASKVDEEVRTMFEEIQRDYPDFFCRTKTQESLSGNEYLHAINKPVLFLHLEEADIYKRSLESKIQAIGEGGAFVYAPGSSLDALRPGHLQNALLAMAFQDLDFILVSHSLLEPPMVGITSVNDATVFRERAKRALQGDEPRELRGRVARLLPGVLPARNLKLPFDVNWGATALSQPGPDGIIFERTGKPMMFVLPALFAVGGVERLMVEMMRQLRDRYDFVVITVERLSANHGSLHGEAEGVAVACYDLAEIAPPELFLPMMRRLKEIYQPSIVWIPNGSPWQCGNAGGIREVFRNTPIVDQQAYDTEAGWISRYGDAGIQSYDRFIAINTKIRQVQIERYRIPAGKIDLIYHSINLDALGPMARTETQRSSYREKYGLPAAGTIFGWVGRLTRQKRPLEFLEFVERHPNDHFVMIGNGDLASDCDAFIAEREIRNLTAVRFSNAMAELFATMSGLLSSSEYEGLPISMLEAIAMAVPVFSTDVGDVGLILSEYECGTVTQVAWDINRYSADFLAWKEMLPFRADDAATKIRSRFGGPSVAALYDSCFRTALSDFRAV